MQYEGGKRPCEHGTRQQRKREEDATSKLALKQRCTRGTPPLAHAAARAAGVLGELGIWGLRGARAPRKMNPFCGVPDSEKVLSAGRAKFVNKIPI